MDHRERRQERQARSRTATSFPFLLPPIPCHSPPQSQAIHPSHQSQPRGFLFLFDFRLLCPPYLPSLPSIRQRQCQHPRLPAALACSVRLNLRIHYTTFAPGCPLRCPVHYTYPALQQHQHLHQDLHLHLHLPRYQHQRYAADLSFSLSCSSLLSNIPSFTSPSSPSSLSPGISKPSHFLN